MKITVEHCDTAENQIILRCRELDEEMLSVLSMLKAGEQRLCGWNERRETVLLEPRRVLYAEGVEDKTFLYLEGEMYRTALALWELCERWEAAGFVRAGKSTVINLRRIKRLKSCSGGRIEATLENEERVMISRHYAPMLREQLGV